MGTRFFPVLICLLCLLAGGCPEGRPPEVPGRGAVKADAHAKKTLGFRLGNDDTPASLAERAKPVPATPLSEVDAKVLAARLPPVAATPDDAKAFSFPAKSLAAPPARKTVEEAFLAHVVLPDGRTVYESTKKTVALAYETGQTQPLLPAPGRSG